MPNLAELVDLSCGRLRRVASHEPRVVAALLTMPHEAPRRASTDADRADLRRQVDLLHADAWRAIVQPADREALVDTPGR